LTLPDLPIWTILKEWLQTFDSHTESLLHTLTDKLTMVKFDGLESLDRHDLYRPLCTVLKVNGDVTIRVD